MTQASEESTLSFTAPSSKPEVGGREHLFLVLASHRPLDPPARCALAGLDEVVIGRGRTRVLEYNGDAGVRRLSIRLDDPWLSSMHARLTRVLGRWVFEDAGSKNGSLVNGVPQARADLTDG